MLKPHPSNLTAETREKLLALAEFIETDRSAGFYMGTWLVREGDGWSNAIAASDAPECGTAACLGGHYQLMTERDADADLRLTLDQRDALFFPDSHICSNDRTKAVRVLRHFAYTGDIDWSV